MNKFAGKGAAANREKSAELMTEAERAVAQGSQWKEYKTAEGRVYWYHKGTKQSTWTRPAAVRAEDAIAPPAPRPASMAGPAREARVVALEAEDATLRGPLVTLEAELDVAKQVAALKRQIASAAETERDELAAALKKRKKDAERNTKELREAERQLALFRDAEAARLDPQWRDWGNALGRGLPADVLAKVAERYVARTEAEYEAWFRKDRADRLGWNLNRIGRELARRKRKGRGLFAFAMVCRGWRRVQLTVGKKLCSRTVSDVLMLGRVELAKWALAEGCPSREHGDASQINRMASAAVRYGHLELTQWLLKKRGSMLDRQVMVEAAASGKVELVRWLGQRGCQCWGLPIMETAARYGHLALVKWLRTSRKYNWNESEVGHVGIGVMQEAILSGNLELVQWLWAAGCPHGSTSSAISNAARTGNRDLVRWLHAKPGCSVRQNDTRSIYVAAGRGDLEMVQLAVHQLGGGWSPEAAAAATRGGHLEVIQWMRANCPWNPSNATMEQAVASGNLELVQWLRTEGCPSSDESGLLLLAAEKGHLALAQWLLQEPDFTATSMDSRVMLNAARSGSLELVQWLRTEGCPWTPSVVEAAVESGNLKLVRWLTTTGRCPWNDSPTLRAAVRNGDLEMVQWLRSLRCCQWPPGYEVRRRTYLHMQNADMMVAALECQIVTSHGAVDTVDMSRFVPLVRWMR